MGLGYSLIDLHLMFEKSSLKNYVWKIKFEKWCLKNQVWNIKLDELDFLSILYLMFYFLSKNQVYNWQKNQVRPTWFFKDQVQINMGLF